MKKYTVILIGIISFLLFSKHVNAQEWVYLDNQEGIEISIKRCSDDYVRLKFSNPSNTQKIVELELHFEDSYGNTVYNYGYKKYYLRPYTAHVTREYYIKGAGHVSFSKFEVH